MYWRIVLDYGTHKDLYPVHSSEWAANHIANRWREIANMRGDKVNITVEAMK